MSKWLDSELLLLAKHVDKKKNIEQNLDALQALFPHRTRDGVRRQLFRLRKPYTVVVSSADPEAQDHEETWTKLDVLRYRAGAPWGSSPERVKTLLARLELERANTAKAVELENLPTEYCTPSEAQLEKSEEPVAPIPVDKPKLPPSVEAVRSLADAVHELEEAKVVDYLVKERGYSLNTQAIPNRETKIIDFKPSAERTFKVAVISCTHFGNKHQQPTNLRAFYERCREEGVEVVLHAGDVVDGESMYQGHAYGLFAHGADAQVKAAVEQYPKIPGIKTKCLLGNHDEAFLKRAGVHVVKRIAHLRDDFEYLGDHGTRVVLPGGFTGYLHHGDGGVGYARSYKLQNYIRGVQGRGQEVPAAYFLGHYHCTAILPSYMGTLGIQLGCWESSTDYMIRKGLHAEIGGFIIEYKINCDGAYDFNTVKTTWCGYRPVHNDY